MPKVSIVIVCMNSVNNLYPCLDSIETNTLTSYETFVVAYLFDELKLKDSKLRYPWVKFIESNEIRGFSENNNLALRMVTGEYCFVVNDDTYHNMPVIDNLVDALDSLPYNVAVVSPEILNKDGSVQRCGRPKYNLWTYTFEALHLSKLLPSSKFVNQSGLFESYNLSGACFMIRTDVFRHFGWFDERFFFCPEDVALSTLLQKNGYKCYVQQNTKLTHACGQTRGKTFQATMPASAKGNYIFYGMGKWYRESYFIAISTVSHLMSIVYWFFKGRTGQTSYSRLVMRANLNAILALFSNMTPKQLFIRYYKR